MKSVFMAVVLAIAATSSAAQVNRVLVRQQWPWSADVRVEYIVSGAAAPIGVSFRFYDGDDEIAVSDASAVKGDGKYAKNGTNVITFNPKALFGPAAPKEYMKFSVKVELGEENAPMGDKLYRIVDLDTGAVDDLVRADFYNGKYGAFETSYSAINPGFSTGLQDVFIWTDVTNNIAYRTSKMVFRRIPAKNIEWLMGTNSSGLTLPIPAGRHLVKLTSDFYIGVFPVTQAQYGKLNAEGSMGRLFIDDEKYPGHESFPVHGIPYSTWRGNNNWPADGHQCSEDSYFAALRRKTGSTIVFDLPTEAQWEFACRGGNYESILYSGKSYSTSSLLELGWCQDNSKVDGASQPHPVGEKYPNAYGLYDMLGNMHEWCLDWTDQKSYAWTSLTEPEVDPKGVPKSDNLLDKYGNGQHIIRGASYNLSRVDMFCANRRSDNNSSTGAACARICCIVEE